MGSLTLQLTHASVWGSGMQGEKVTAAELWLLLFIWKINANDPRPRLMFLCAWWAWSVGLIELRQTASGRLLVCSFLAG
jgi:hypothetical protein